MEKISLKEFIEKYWNSKKYEDKSFIFQEDNVGGSVTTTPYLFKSNNLNIEFSTFSELLWGEVKNKESKYMGLQFSFNTVAIYDFGVSMKEFEIEIPQEED